MGEQPTAGLIAGRYRLERQIGRGAMGSVWLARDDRLRRTVALKVLASMWTGAAEARVRFEREAMAAAALRSPHIVQIFDYGIDGSRPFIVMELLEGEDLRHRLKRQGRLSVEDTARIIHQASKALRAAHKANVVHRDLKPANLMLDTSTGEEMLKVLDFGVAKAPARATDDCTQAGSLLGTPHFMAPEQARGLPDVDHRADLWSLAIIAFRALTGRLPFRAKVIPDLIVKICTSPLPRATAICPDLPPLVDAFFAKALDRDRDGRFQSAAELCSSFFRVFEQSLPSMSGAELPLPSGAGRPSGGDLRAGAPEGPGDTHPSGRGPLPSLPDTFPSFASPQSASSSPAAATSSAGTAASLEPQPSSGTAAASQGKASSLGTQATMVDDLPAALPQRKRIIGVVAAMALIVAALVWLLVPNAPAPRDEEGAAASNASSADTSRLATTEQSAAEATSAPAHETTAVASAAPSAAPSDEAAATARPAAVSKPRLVPPQHGTHTSTGRRHQRPKSSSSEEDLFLDRK